MKTLLTGATGFLGTFVQESLQGRHSFKFLTRQNIHNGIRGDITSWNMGLDPEALKGEFDALIHLAGLYDLRATEDKLQLTNVVGTHNALSFAKKAQIPIFANASTIAVTLNQSQDPISAYALDLNQPFPDAYARTKAAAEQLVKEASQDFKCVLNYRLGILVGSTQNGRIERIDGPYGVVQSLSRIQKLLKLAPKHMIVPGIHKRRMPIVPVNIAAKAIVDLTEIALEKDLSGYQSYYLTPNKGLHVKEYYRDSFQYLGLNLKPILTENISTRILTKAFSFLDKNLPAEEMQYLMKMPRFDTQPTTDLLGLDWCPEYSDYKNIFWKGYDDYISNRRN